MTEESEKSSLEFNKLSRGLYVLQSGSPVYKHNHCPGVPWPKISENLRREIFTNGNSKVSTDNTDEDNTVESILVSTPNRIMYNVAMKNFPIKYKIEKNSIMFRLVDGSFYNNTQTIYDYEEICTNITPGKVYLQDLWLMAENVFESYLPTKIVISMPFGKTFNGSVLQEISNVKDLLYILHNHGCPVLYPNMCSLPVFFSRDPAYGFPLFLPNAIDVYLVYEQGLPNLPIELRASMEIVHNQEEYRLAISSYSIFKERITNEFSFFVPTWWNYNGTSISSLPKEPISFVLPYDGGTDEEIRGVFFRISDGEKFITHVEINFYFGEETYNQCLPILFKENFIHAVYRDRDTRILPTISCKDQQIISSQCDYGGFLFSRSFDTKDCEPGLVPRNGKLVLTFHRDGIVSEEEVGDMSISVFTLTNRDIIFSRV